MDEIDIEKFRVKTQLATKQGTGKVVLPRHKKGEKFLAGPIPWNWWAEAARLSGKPLHIASAIWLLASIKKSATIQLPSTILRELGVSRKSVYRALGTLEKAGLIACDHGPGRRPIITILDISVTSNGNGNESDTTGGNA